MKPASDTSALGRTVVTTQKTTTIEPEAAKMPDFWEFVEKLRSADWEKYLVYIYRQNQDNKGTCIYKSPGYLEHGSVRVPLSDREETEFTMATKFGGGEFRLILKRGGQRISETRVFIDGPRKNLVPMSEEHSGSPNSNGGSNGNGNMNGNSGVAEIAGKAIDTINNRDQQAIIIATQALASTAEMVSRLSRADTPAPSASDDVFKQFMVLAMQKMMNPPNPLETLMPLLTLMKEFKTATAEPGSAQDPIVKQILDAGLQRVLNPPSSGDGRPNATAALVGILPTLGTQIVSGMQEYAKIAQAQTAAIALSRGAPPPQPHQPQLPAAPSNVTPINEVKPPEGQAMPAQNEVESKIVEIFKKPVSAEEAAEEALAYLNYVAPEAIDQLVSFGKIGIIGYFQTNATLKQIPHTQRLVDFVEKFLEFAKEPPPAAGESPDPTKAS